MIQYKIKEIIQFDDTDYVKGDIVTIEVDDKCLELPDVRGTKLRKINIGKITYIDSDYLEVDCSTEFDSNIMNIKYKLITSVKKEKPIGGKRREIHVLEDYFTDDGVEELYKSTGVPKQFFEGYKPQEYFKTGVSYCDNCSSNLKNGGSGICNCTLGLSETR